MPTTSDIIGVDPGITETGVVLLREGKYLAGATIQGNKYGTDVERVDGLVQAFVAVVETWVLLHDLKSAAYVFETPIMRRPANPETFKMQCRVLHALEGAVLYIKGVLPFALLEVTPSESKFAATGKGLATKEEVINASPFATRMDIPYSTREALADAWAHATTVGKRKILAHNWKRTIARVYTDAEVQ